MGNQNDYSGQPIYSKDACDLMRRISALWAGMLTGIGDSPRTVASPGVSSFYAKCEATHSKTGATHDVAVTITTYDASDDSVVSTTSSTTYFAGTGDFVRYDVRFLDPDNTEYTFSVTSGINPNSVTTATTSTSGDYVSNGMLFTRLPESAPGIPWYKYTVAGGQESIGDEPADDALVGSLVDWHVLYDLRDTLQHMVAEAGSNGWPYSGFCKYLNPSTGNPYNWIDDSPDNLYCLAMGDRTKYGATGGAKYYWTNASLAGQSIYDIDIGEISECVALLEAADTQ